MAKANDKIPAKNESSDNVESKDRQTSGNCEENMESDNDVFGEPRSARSGTTPLAGEPSTSNDKPEPGGVEGTGDTN